MAKIRTLDDIDPQAKIVLLRADLNVPVKDGKVTDATRVTRLTPTIRELLGKGARVAILSHFGRPRGKRDPSLSLRPLVEPLTKALGLKSIAFAEDCIGSPAQAVVAALKPGEAVLLENLRFHMGEEANDPDFAKALGALGEIYVNDAFSAAHRAHASTEALAHLLPAVAGRLMQEELAALAAALETPERPLIAIVGGAKVSTKLALLTSLIPKVDHLVIGGAMANTMLFAQGKAVGTSLCERDLAATARDIIAQAERARCDLVLPIDAMVAEKLKPGATTAIASIDAIPPDRMILDLGPATVAAIVARLKRSRTLVWNGPVGAFETPPFDAGTTAIAQEVALLTAAGKLRSVAGGGDTNAALAHAGVIDELSYVSTAGGAFLEWLEGRTLPGVAALKRD